MLKDVQGLDVTTQSPTAIAALNRFIQQALTYGHEAEAAILEALMADPLCAIANAYAAAYYLSQENNLDRQRALPYLRSARFQLAEQPSITQRERLYIQGIDAWANGQIDRAIAYHETIADDYPEDLISLQQGQYHYFYEGNKAGLLHIAEKTQSVNANHPDFLGMLAFALEQNHRLPEAERIGRQATTLKRDNPWAHHAVAHVLETQGRAAEGIAWMESLADTWTSCNSMLYTHNWWHVALFYLKQGDVAAVLSLYDTYVWGQARKQTPKDQVGAIALLLRLEVQGVRLDRQWQELTPYLLPRIHEHALPFQDLHYVYALARSAQFHSANELLVSMVAHAQTLEQEQRRRRIEIAVPAARAMIAHATGHWQEAITHLRPVLPQLWKLGGSHAQRHLFEQIYRHAHQQAERNRVLPAPSHVIPRTSSFALRA